MAITLVASGNVGAATNNGNDITINFPTLSQNDVVIVFGGHFNRSGSTVGPSTGGYTSLVNSTAQNPYFDVSWKRMGASPDTSVVCNGTGNTADAAAYGVYCLRGVHNQDSPVDVTTTTGTGSSTNPDCPSITTALQDDWILAVAMSVVSDASVTIPSGYSNGVAANANDTNAATVGGGTKTLTTPAAENPASFTGWGSGAWFAATIAIKPNVPLTNTSVLATASVGTVIPSRSVPVTGVSATASVGTVVPSRSVPVTGVSSTASVGTAGVSVTVSISGVVATAAVGDVVPSTGGDVTIPITGVSATASVGTVIPTRLVPITGISATASVGAVSPATSASITGVSAVASVGAVTPTRSVPVTGVSSTASVGTVLPNNVRSISGVEASSSVGGVGVDSKVGITGVVASTGIGTPIPSISVGLTGVMATGAVGTVTPVTGGDVTIAISGVSSSGNVGNLFPGHSLALLGVNATGAVGDLARGGKIMAFVLVEVTDPSASQFRIVVPG